MGWLVMVLWAVGLLGLGASYGYSFGVRRALKLIERALGAALERVERDG